MLKLDRSPEATLACKPATGGAGASGLASVGALAAGGEVLVLAKEAEACIKVGSSADAAASVVCPAGVSAGPGKVEASVRQATTRLTMPLPGGSNRTVSYPVPGAPLPHGRGSVRDGSRAATELRTR